MRDGNHITKPNHDDPIFQTCLSLTYFHRTNPTSIEQAQLAYLLCPAPWLLTVIPCFRFNPVWSVSEICGYNASWWTLCWKISLILSLTPVMLIWPWWQLPNWETMEGFIFVDLKLIPWSVSGRIENSSSIRHLFVVLFITPFGPSSSPLFSRLLSPRHVALQWKVVWMGMMVMLENNRIFKDGYGEMDGVVRWQSSQSK